MTRAASKNGADLGGDRSRRLDGVEPLELRPTGHPEGTVDVNLTGLMCRILAIADDKGVTWAQKVVEGWIDDAATGDHRATLDIFDRAEKGRMAGASAADAPPQLRDQTASKILEALCGDGQVPAGD